MTNQAISVTFGGQPLTLSVGSGASQTAAVRAEDASELAQAWAEGTLPGGAGTKSAKEWSEESALSAATAEAIAGPTYASTAAGLAATTSGQAFAVDAGGGLVSVYLNSSGTAVLQRTLATTGALAASDGSALVGFLQSGTGATARTVQSKLRDVVSVKDFGAVGDGVTDDTAAIQAAIDAAMAGNARVVRLGSLHKITDINLTKLYYCGLIIEGDNLTHQPTGAATLIVSGATSQGLDLSGTSGLVFRNISIRGDSAAAPRCGIFAQRILGSQESYGHTFDNVRVYGNYTKAGVYNYAGEFWDFRSGVLWCEGGGGRAGYFTSTNSLGLTSKFQTPDNTVTPLTVTSFRKMDIKGVGEEAIWFEQQTATSGDRTIQNILFDGCYTRANGGAANVMRFTEIFGGLTIRNCTDESFATANPTAAPTTIKIEGARQFSRLSIEDNVFYPHTYIVDASAPILGYCGKNNWVGGGGGRNWRFATLYDASHKYLYDAENFTVTTSAQLVNVMPVNRGAAARISLPSNRMNQGYDFAYGGNPDGVLNPETRGRFLFDTWYNQMRVSVGVPSGADSFSWRLLGEKEVRGSLPTSGNYELGRIIWKSTPAAGGKIGWVCTSTGTFGTLSGVTANTTNGSATATVNTATGLSVGNRVTIAGVSGARTITAISGTTITLNSAADATVAGAAMAFFAPTFKEWGVIDL